MGCNAKNKPLRRKQRNAAVTAGKLTSPSPNPNPPNPNPNLNSLDKTEKELEDLLLARLDFIHDQALARLLHKNYDESLAVHALLSNGHCHGELDALSNVVRNAIRFLENDDCSSSVTTSFTNLRHFQEYSLAGMVCMLQNMRPEITRAQALWCLHAANLNMDRAAKLEIPSAVDDVLKGLEGLKIEKEEEDAGEVIVEMVAKIRDLEMQVQERKEWAQEKAMQAAKRLSNDLTELKLLRMESEENKRVKKGKQAQEEGTMKRLAEMEASLKKASGQVDRANAVVHRLKAENAEIRAEMEACKLSAAESEAVCLEVARRERKSLKRLVAWEKQKEKLQAEVVQEKKDIAGLQRELEEVNMAQKKAEENWRLELKAKEQAIIQLDEERRANEETEASVKRKHELLRRKIELDSQRQKDDIRRLEEELSRLRASAGLTQAPSAVNMDFSKQMGSNPGLNKPKDSSQTLKCNRKCVICKENELSVVFLPCTHLVVCTKCEEEHKNSGKTSCPYCKVRIEERIHVYGGSS